MRIPVMEVPNPQVASFNPNRTAATSRRVFEDRFQQLARQAFDATFECSIHREGMEVVEALTGVVQTLTGISSARTEVTEQWVHLVHPNDHTVVARHIHRVLEGHRDLCVFRIIVPTEGVRWFGTLTRPVWDEGRKTVTHVYGLVQDYGGLPAATVTTAHRQYHETLSITPTHW